MARKNVTSASGSLGCALRMSNRSIPGSDDDTNDIDQQSRDRQHPKQRYIRQGDPKQSVQRVAARSDKPDSETGNRQRQGIFITASLEKETVFPMTSGAMIIKRWYTCFYESIRGTSATKLARKMRGDTSGTSHPSFGGHLGVADHHESFARFHAL